MKLYLNYIWICLKGLFRLKESLPLLDRENDPGPRNAFFIKKFIGPKITREKLSRGTQKVSRQTLFYYLTAEAFSEKELEAQKEELIDLWLLLSAWISETESK